MARPSDGALDGIARLAAEVERETDEALFDAPDVLSWRIAAHALHARELAGGGTPSARVDAVVERLAGWWSDAGLGAHAVLSAATPDAAAATLGVSSPTTWTALRALAEERYLEGALTDAGWADAAACHPPPENPAWELGVARGRIRDVLGDTSCGAARANAPRARDDGAIERLVDAARRLRWIRPHTDDPGWGRAMGALRALSRELALADDHPLVVALDPATNPWPPWAELVEKKRSPTPADDEGAIASDVARARALVAGRSALVVGNRQDPLLARRYESDLGLASIEWCDISQGARAIDAATRRIASGRLDLVLCHTGFVSHSASGKIERACRAAGVRFIAAQKGRTPAAARAILASHGLA